MSKLRPLLGIGVLGTALTLGGGSALAGNTHGWKTIHFRGTSTGGTEQLLASSCDTAGNCINVNGATDPGTLGGDLNGTEIGYSIVTVAPNGAIVIQQSAVFTGTIRGCGTGTLAYTNHGTLQPGDTTFTWVLTLESDTGTGDLTDMSGHAIGHVDLTDPNAVAIAEGTFRCHR
jgi:hypothetical protein